MALIEDSLISYLNTAVEAEDTIDTETALFSSGLLDSVLMLNLIMFVEQNAGIQVRPEDVTLDHFDTPGRIVKYAESAV